MKQLAISNLQFTKYHLLAISNSEINGLSPIANILPIANGQLPIIKGELI